MSAISSAISGMTPICAQQCIVDYATANWSAAACSDTSELNCLCDSYSSTGYSLGEIAELCVAAQCSGATTTDLTTARGICNSVAGHVQPTHTTLVVSVISIRTSTSLDPSTSHTATTLSSLTSQSATMVASTTSTDPATTLHTSITVAASATSQSTFSAIPSTLSSNQTASDMSPSSSRSRNETIGIVLGILAGVGLAFAIFFCCWCHKRKKKTKHEKIEDGKATDDKGSTLEVRCIGPASSPLVPYGEYLPAPPLPPSQAPWTARSTTKPTERLGSVPNTTRQWARIPVVKPPKIFLRPPTTWTRSGRVEKKPVIRRLDSSPSNRFSSATQHTIFEEDLKNSDPHLGTVGARVEPRRHTGIARFSHAAELAQDSLQTAREVSVKKVKLAPLKVQVSPRVGSRSGTSTPTKTPGTAGSLATFIEKNYCRSDNRSTRPQTWFEEDKMPPLKSDHGSVTTPFSDEITTPTPEEKAARRKEIASYKAAAMFPYPPPPPPPPVPIPTHLNSSSPHAHLYSPSIYTCDERGHSPGGWI